MRWLLNLKWKQGLNNVTSWIELASEAWHCGVRLSIKNSPKVYMQMIQKVVNQTRKVDDSICLIPGIIQKM